jgi:23S rRNA pseudouridine1911/1915/1917 synthase
MDSERVDIEWDEPEEDAEEAEQSLTGPPERMRITVGKKQEQLRIDKFLMNHVEGATRNKIQQAIDEGLVLVNGGNIKSSYKIRPLDEIVIMETRKGELIEVIPEPMDLEIVYEDDHILIVNKHPGIVVHPGCGNYTGTLVNGLAWHLGHREAISDALPRVGLVHRIDKDTSGLVVVGKTEAALTSLGAQFKKHTVHRRYVALAWCDFDENSGTVEEHL